MIPKSYLGIKGYTNSWTGTMGPLFGTVQYWAKFKDWLLQIIRRVSKAVQKNLATDSVVSM